MTNRRFDGRLHEQRSRYKERMWQRCKRTFKLADAEVLLDFFLLAGGVRSPAGGVAGVCHISIALLVIEGAGNVTAYACYRDGASVRHSKSHERELVVPTAMMGRS